MDKKTKDPNLVKVKGRLCVDVKAVEFSGYEAIPLYVNVPFECKLPAGYKSGEGVPFFVKSWGSLSRKRGELKKGDEVNLLVRAERRRWTNELEPGKDISMTVLVAEKLELVRQEKKRAASKAGYERSM